MARGRYGGEEGGISGEVSKHPLTLLRGGTREGQEYGDRDKAAWVTSRPCL